MSAANVVRILNGQRRVLSTVKVRILASPARSDILKAKQFWAQENITSYSSLDPRFGTHGEYARPFSAVGSRDADQLVLQQRRSEVESCGMIVILDVATCSLFTANSELMMNGLVVKVACASSDKCCGLTGIGSNHA